MKLVNFIRTFLRIRPNRSKEMVKITMPGPKKVVWITLVAFSNGLSINLVSCVHLQRVNLLLIGVFDTD